MFSSQLSREHIDSSDMSTRLQINSVLHAFDYITLGVLFRIAAVA